VEEGWKEVRLGRGGYLGVRNVEEWQEGGRDVRGCMA